MVLESPHFGKNTRQAAGTLHLGMGETLDHSAGWTMPAGTFGHWPAGMKHFAWTTGETVIQIYGTGPWAINYVNPADDPRTKKNDFQ